MSKEVYKSTTLGEIPLSFTGRHLLQNLREAITEMVNTKGVVGPLEWEPVSLARGKLAQYMSQLEGKSERQKEMINRNFGQFGGRQQGKTDAMWKVLDVPTFLERKDVPPVKYGDTVYHLPPIPPGYALHIVNGLVAIEPIENKPL